MSGFASPGSKQLGMGLYQGRAVTLDPLLEDCIEWWSLDEESSTRTGKKSLALTDVNTTTSGYGLIHNGAAFVGSNSERLTTTDSDMALASHDEWTISMWVYVDSVSGSDGSHNFVGRANVGLSPANVTEFALTYYSDSYSHAPYRSQLQFWHYTAATYASVVWSAALEADTWYHLVIGYDSSATGAEMWMSVNNATAQTTSDGTGPTVASNGMFSLGSLENNSIYQTGRVDQVACWSRTLTADERTRIYASGAGISYPGEGAVDSLMHRLSCWYSLNETSGARANAANSSVLSLTDNNTVLYSADGKVGNSALFVKSNAEGLSNAVNTHAFSILPNDDFAMAFWSRVPDVTANQVACALWSSATNIEWYIYAPLASSSCPHVYWGQGAGNKNVAAPDSMTNNTWHLIIVEVNRTADTLSISLDNGTPGSVSFGGGTINESKGITLEISKNPYMDGDLDEFAIWHRLLTSAEKTRLAAGMAFPG